MYVYSCLWSSSLFPPARGTLYIPECVYLLLKDGVCVSVYIKDILI